MMRTIVLLGALALLAPALPPNDKPKATLADVVWMAGTWKGTDRGTSMEELWTNGQGGLMLGLHRDVRAGRAVSFEFLRIEETPDGLVYQASPRGAPATAFPLIELGTQRAVFANPEHDFPKRILYWLDAQDGLHAKVDAGEGTKGQEWRWERVR